MNEDRFDELMASINEAAEMQQATRVTLAELDEDHLEKYREWLRLMLNEAANEWEQINWLHNEALKKFEAQLLARRQLEKANEKLKAYEEEFAALREMVRKLFVPGEEK